MECPKPLTMTTEGDSMITSTQNSTNMDSSRTLKSLLYPNSSNVSRLNNSLAHNETKSSFKRQRIECQQCNFTTMRKDRLNRHMIDVHTSFKTFKCDVCMYVANSKINLETHTKEVHNNRDEILTLATDESSSTGKPDLNNTATTSQLNESSVQSNNNTSLLDCLSAETNINLN